MPTPKQNLPDTIRFYHPYRVVLPMDPRKLFSVGDQVLSEHIFAFHSRESIRSGFQPVFSDVQINRAAGTVRIKPLYPLKRSYGSLISENTLCTLIEQGFKGTTHAPYQDLFIKSECKEGAVTIYLKKIPVNLRYLFTLADLSIYETNTLPLTLESRPETTGPYQIEKMEERTVWLKRNPHYPKELTANQVENAVFEAYRPAETDKFVAKLDPARDHLIYFSGQDITTDLLSSLKRKNYRINQFPSEWVLFVSFWSRVAEKDKHLIGEVLDEARKEIMANATLGQEAFSLAPADRPFGLSQSEYRALLKQEKPKARKLSKNYVFGKIGILEQHPFYQKMIEVLQRNFKEIKFINYQFKDMKSLEADIDICFESIGLSAADPLNHLSFIRTVHRDIAAILTEKRLTEIAQLEDADAFIAAIKRAESELVAKRVFIPIAHFPGVVAEAPRFERDENLAWSWGTQAWTYRIR